jgi:hypothetical protein
MLFRNKDFLSRIYCLLMSKMRFIKLQGKSVTLLMVSSYYWNPLSAPFHFEIKDLVFLK